MADKGEDVPPLPDEKAPPLPNDAPPSPNEAPPDDGWEALWDYNYQAWYFYNRFNQITTWVNPRVPDTTAIPPPPGTDGDEYWAARRAPTPSLSSLFPTKRPVGSYDPAIHGNFDPNAEYALAYASDEEEQTAVTEGALTTNVMDPNDYATTANFNRFTGKYQTPDINPDRHNDDNKSRRQLNAFYDVDAQANSHEGRSLKAERKANKPTKKQIKEYNKKRKEKKEEKRRAFLRD
ncbi:MAG: hypothetical protein M1820_001579 [Bogoriella megaspora]|nr:MAG: hypothetical protein M1820_001579 [Bogoriella megaspora]